MSKVDKILTKLRNSNNTFSWSALVTLLKQLGYEKQEMAGSRVRFYNAETDQLILLHKPHPENEIKGGALKAIKDVLL
jgi:predicted RNA binding protein YcfA (HicA-like mRNA interferase family)